MRKCSSSVALFAMLFVAAAIGCSDDEGSTIDTTPHASAGAAASSGGSPASASNAGRAAIAGTTGSAGTTTTAGTSAGTSNPNLPTEACAGLPIDLSGDARAGAGAGGAAAGGQSAGDPDDEACNGVSVEAEAVPVDVFVMMDRSQSMSELVRGGAMTRWEALHDAVESFTEAPGAANIRAGIGFFSLSGGGDDAQDCDAKQYAEPSVPIGFLSEVGPKLTAAMDDVVPGGFTPTVPALQGAIRYAEFWAQDNPGRATIVVLVTDGFPTQCEKDPDQITQAARAGYEGSEHIRTFVIGVGDVAKFNLDNFARAGGSRHAYLTDAGDVTTTFVDALNNITNGAIACEYELPEAPEGMKLDSAKVQVVYTPATGDTEEVPSIPSLSACGKNANGGWYYDDPDHPSKITVCPCTCARFQAGRVDVRLGCKPRLGLR